MTEKARPSSLETRLPLIVLGATVVVVIALSIVAITGLPTEDVNQAGDAPTVTESGQALIGGPFELVDHTGRTVTQADFSGRHMLIYFGFTYCPDACPMTLEIAAAALDQLGDKADKVQPIFITVDPERDTQEAMAEYVAAFDPRLVGLTGSREQIDAVTKAYRVYARKAASMDAGPNDYLMDHSSLLYLMDENGTFVTFFRHGAPVSEIVQGLDTHLG